MKDPLRYDCDDCEEPCEGDSNYCEECPYDPMKILFRIARDHDDFPDPVWVAENIWPMVGRAFSLQADIEILGSPLNALSEVEMESLRVLKDEQTKRQMHEHDRLTRKTESSTRRGPNRWRGR